MQRKFATSVLVLVALVMGTGVLFFYWQVIRAAGTRPKAAESAAAPSLTLDAPNVTFVDPSTGPKDAPNVIVEFGDYLCPYCQSSEAAVEKLLEARTDVRFVWKHFPSPLHVGAEAAAEAAMCADRQGAFWAYHRKLFESQTLYDDVSLSLTASDLGLDVKAFTACLSSHETKPLVDRTVGEARALGIDSLPTFYVNGAAIEGAITYEDLQQILH